MLLRCLALAGFAGFGYWVQQRRQGAKTGNIGDEKLLDVSQGVSAIHEFHTLIAGSVGGP